MKDGIIALGAALLLLASPTFAAEYDSAGQGAEHKQQQEQGMQQAAQQGQQQAQQQAQQQGQNNLAASQLIGAEVESASTGEEIGEVQDLVIDSDQQKIHAVIQVGGTMGMGGRTVAIDAADLQPNAEGSALQLNKTQQELEAMPEFDVQQNTRQLQAGR